MPKKIIVSVHATLIIFALFTLLFGLKLRFSNLNLPFWGDEYQTINAAKGIGRLPETCTCNGKAITPKPGKFSG